MLLHDMTQPDINAVAMELAALRDISDTRHGCAEAVARMRHEIIMVRMDTIEARLSAMQTAEANRHRTLMWTIDIERRLERVEARQAAGTAV